MKNLLKFGLYHTTEGEVFGKSFEFIFSHFSNVLLLLKMNTCGLDTLERLEWT